MRRNRYSSNSDYGYNRHRGNRKRKRKREYSPPRSKKRKIVHDEQEKKHERLDAWKKKLSESSIRKDVELFENFKKKKPLSFKLKGSTSSTIVPPPPQPSEKQQQQSSGDESSNFFSFSTKDKESGVSILSPSEFLEQSKIKSEVKDEEEEEEEEEIDPFDVFMQKIDDDLKKVEKVEKIKKSKIITMEDLFSIKDENQSEKDEDIDDDNEETKDGEKFHKMFIKALKNNETGGNRELFEADESLVAEGVVEYEVDQPRVIKSTKKDLKKVDHSEMNYLPFQKVFYIPPRELSKLSEEEIKHRRSKLGKITMKGKGIPCPIETWYQCGFDSTTLQTLERSNYQNPFPIQSQAIPCILGGRNLIGIAPTGSGKTIAFLLPLLRHVLAQPRLEPGDGPIGLVLAPTRELAQQIYKELRKFADPLNVRCTCVFGGGSMSDQIAQLKFGSHVIVCTPGRMIDLLCANRGRVTNLARVTYVVLDEADRMFDFGFGPQISRVLENIRPDRQIVLFSATFPRPLESLARKLLKNSVQLIVGGRSVANEKIRQFVEILEEKAKFLRLLELFGIWFGKGSILVFVRGKEETGNLYRDIFAAGYDALVLHSGMDQMDRSETLRQFKKGEKTVLIGTSLVARGIDVQDIELVINYDVPHHYEDYVHQVGRTARANREGTSYTFLRPTEDEYSPELVKALKQSGNPIPSELVEMRKNYFEKKKKGIARRRHAMRGYMTSGFQFNKEEGGQKQKKTDLEKQALGIDEQGNFVDPSTYYKTLQRAQHPNNKNSNSMIVPPPPMRKTVDELDLEELEKERKRLEELETSRKAKLVSLQQQKKTGLKEAGVNEVTQALAFAKTLTIQASLNQYENGDSNQNIQTDGSDSISQQQQQQQQQQGHSSELEINDYPQIARWKVTRSGSDYLTRILEEIPGTRVITKGEFVAAGEVVPPGKRKLYLLIEGNSSEDVEMCKLRILQVMKKAMEPRKKKVENVQQNRKKRNMSPSNHRQYHMDRRYKQLKGYSVVQ